MSLTTVTAIDWPARYMRRDNTSRTPWVEAEASAPPPVSKAAAAATASTAADKHPRTTLLARIT